MRLNRLKAKYDSASCYYCLLISCLQGLLLDGKLPITRIVPRFGTGSQLCFGTGSQLCFGTGSQLGFGTSSQLGFGTGSRLGFGTGSQLGFRTGSQL